MSSTDPVTTRSRDPATGGWLSTDDLPAEAGGNGTLRSWLLETGSITERLRRQCGDRFRLRLLGCHNSALAPDDAALLGIDPEPEVQALVREIRMCCDDRICIYARTIVPTPTLQAHPWLADLGERPLGDALTEHSPVQRSPFGYRELTPADALYRSAIGVQPLAEGAHRSHARPTQAHPNPGPAPQAQGTWVRRSLFGLAGAGLLVYEVFLPGVVTCPEP